MNLLKLIKNNLFIQNFVASIISLIPSYLEFTASKYLAIKKAMYITAHDATRGNYLEFGVGRGNSLRWWSENNINPKSVFWGFDTYEGLPEKYGTYNVGTFSLQGNFPDISDIRIQFIKGLFQDTLLNTIPKIDFEKKIIIHIDGDLYSSALFSLSILYPYLKKGDLIIFDEFVVPLHEFRAFDDFLKSFYLKLEPIGAINNYLQIIFEITEIKK